MDDRFVIFNCHFGSRKVFLFCNKKIMSRIDNWPILTIIEAYNTSLFEGLGFNMNENDFLSQIQCDELTSYEPTQEDWEEYNQWLEEQEASEPLPEEDFDDITS